MFFLFFLIKLFAVHSWLLTTGLTFYEHIKKAINDYSAIPAVGSFSPASNINSCISIFKVRLEALEADKNHIKNLGCSASSMLSGNNNNEPCPGAYANYKHALDLAVNTYHAYKNTEEICPTDMYYEKYLGYKSFIENLTGKEYDPETNSADTCVSKVNQVYDGLTQTRNSLISAHCDNITSYDSKPECQQKIETFKNKLNLAYEYLYGGEIETCRLNTKFDEVVGEHIKFYNNIPVNKNNNVVYGVPSREDFHINDDPIFCPLGDDVTQDLVGILRIMKIIAPILVLAYTVYETIKAMTNDDMEKEAKNIFKRFAKRCAAAVLLFVIPVLIDAIMQLLNVWDNAGRCVLTESNSRVTLDDFLNNGNDVEADPLQNGNDVSADIINTNTNSVSTGKLNTNKPDVVIEPINTNPPSVSTEPLITNAPSVSAEPLIPNQPDVQITD